MPCGTRYATCCTFCAHSAPSEQADAECKLSACEKQLLGCKERISGLTAELEAERSRAAKVSWPHPWMGQREEGVVDAGGPCLMPGQQLVQMGRSKCWMQNTRQGKEPCTQYTAECKHRRITCCLVLAQAKADGEALGEERCQLALQQQALKYERRISEAEAAGCGERTGIWHLLCSSI